MPGDNPGALQVLLIVGQSSRNLFLSRYRPTGNDLYLECGMVWSLCQRHVRIWDVRCMCDCEPLVVVIIVTWLSLMTTHDYSEANHHVTY